MSPDGSFFFLFLINTLQLAFARDLENCFFSSLETFFCQNKQVLWFLIFK